MTEPCPHCAAARDAIANMRRSLDRYENSESKLSKLSALRVIESALGGRLPS